jgi:hypothetical protein
MRATQYRPFWHSLGEAYVQQWTSFRWYDDDDDVDDMRLIQIILDTRSVGTVQFESM